MEELINIKKYYEYLKRKFIINNYYTSIVKNGKNLHAIFFDFICVSIFFIIIIASIIYKITEELISTIGISIILIVVYVFLFLLYNSKKRHKKMLKIYEDIANEKIVREMKEKDNRKFILYIKEIMEKYYNVKFYKCNTFIDLIGEINNELYAIKCFKKPLNTKVSLDDLNNFIMEINEKKINEGIIVTNTYFTEDLKNQSNFILIDFNHLKRILKEIGKYPTLKDIEDLIILKYQNRKNEIKEKVKSKDKVKALKFVILGIILIVYSRFVNYKLYYKVTGYISLSIGLIIGVYNIIKSINNKIYITK